MSSDAIDPVAAERYLADLASNRSSIHQLFYPSLESEVVGPYMASRRRHYTDGQWAQLVYGMHTSCTLYVGNLAFTTREEQIFELFSRVAPVRRVIMGLNSNTRTPCGFAFVEMFDHEAALAAAELLNGLKLDDRIMKADLDAAFEEGRQYGRGRTGGQITDDLRSDFDAARGGWGTLQQARKERAEQAERMKKAQTDQFGNGMMDDEDEYGNANPQYDPETYGGGYERPTMSSIFNIDRPLKLSPATIAACTPSIFPHYGLPLDERTRKALNAHLEELNPTMALSLASTDSAMVDAVPSTHSPTAKRSYLPADDEPTPPPSDHEMEDEEADRRAHRRPHDESEDDYYRDRRHSDDDDDHYSRRHSSDDDDRSHRRSPAAKRARHISSSSPSHRRSPQPQSPQPRSPQPRSPQPQHRRNDYYSEDDDDRTPQRLDDDDRTPHRLDDHLSDDDRTPQHISPDRNQSHGCHNEMRDDDATPPPSDHDQPDFDSFEKK